MLQVSSLLVLVVSLAFAASIAPVAAAEDRPLSSPTEVRDILVKMCASVRETRLSVLDPAPGPGRLTQVDCARIVEENADRILALPRNQPDDGTAALEMLADACIRMHHENQGWPIRWGWCRIGSHEMSRSALNLHRLFEEALAKRQQTEHEVLSAAARRRFLAIFSIGSSMTEAVGHLTSLGFKCTEDSNASQVSCTYGHSYLGIYDSKPESFCGEEWHFSLKSDGSETLRFLEVANAIGCL